MAPLMNKAILYPLAMVVGVIVGYGAHSVTRPHQQTFHEITNKINSMKLSQASNDSILFFGDSITQGLNDGDISVNHVNLGIGGDTVDDILSRMKATDINQYKGVFIEGGANNFLHGDNGKSVGEAVSSAIDYAAQSAKSVYVSHVFVPNREINKSVSADALTANDIIDKKCSEIPNCTVVLVPSEIIDHDGMRKNYSIEDGVHLNGQGYNLWKKEINKSIQ